MSPLYAKLQELGGVFASISESKLKNILQLSCCILKTRNCNLQKCRDDLSSMTGEQGLKQVTAYSQLKRVFQTGIIDPVLKTIFLLILYLLDPKSLFRFGLYLLKQKVQGIQHLTDYLCRLVSNISKKLILIKNGVQP